MQAFRVPGILPVWGGLSIAIFTGLSLAVIADQRVIDLGLTAAAISIVVAAVSVQIAHPQKSREFDARALQATHIAATAFFIGGFSWVLAGQFSGADPIAARDGSLLLLAGGTILALNHLPSSSSRTRAIAYPIWFLSLVLAVLIVFTAGALLSIGNPFDVAASSTGWVVATLVGILGLTLFAAMTVTQVLEMPPSPWRAPHLLSGLGWGLLGISFVVHAASIVQPVPPAAGWWYPLMAAGALIISAQGSTDGKRDQSLSIDSRRTRPAAPLSPVVWVSMLLLAGISAATSVWVGRDPLSSRDWSLVSASISMLLVSTTAIVVTTLTSRDRITRLSGRVSALLRLSHTDALTGLANRRSIDARLAAEIQRAARFNHPLTIGLIDIDDFKSINDRYGHTAGDLVLRRIASLLERELRSIDILGRYGGEEFLMVLPETDIAGARVAAERILHMLIQVPAGPGHDRHPVTVSIGLAEFSVNGRSAPDMLEAADAALYRAKREGKNRAVAAEPRTP